MTAKTEAVVVRAPTQVPVDDIEGVIWSLFSTALEALQQGQPVVVVVDDEDLAAQADPIDAALAHAALGVCRALAVEGNREGWNINTVASIGDESADAEWIERLSEPTGVNGIVIRQGASHLGRVPA